VSPDTTPKARMKVIFEVSLEDLSSIVSTLDIYFMTFNYWIEEITYLDAHDTLPDFAKQESRRA
jgi:hypothetical protein